MQRKIIWDVMERNLMLFLIKVCRVDCLPYALWRISHHYTADISAGYRQWFGLLQHC